MITPPTPVPKPGDLLIYEQRNGRCVSAGLILKASPQPDKPVPVWTILWDDGQTRVGSPDSLWPPSRILRRGALIA